MTEATFDKSRLLALHFRIGEDGVPIILTFVNEDLSPYAIDTKGFKLAVKSKPGAANIFLLEEGDGLEVIGASLNKLQISPVAANTTGQRPGTNFLTLYSAAEDHTWLNGPAKFHNGDFDGVGYCDDETITICANGSEITIIISTVDTGNSWVPCGTFVDANDVYPPPGNGSGANGAIKAFNTFISTAGAMYNGNFLPAGSVFVALIDAPGQAAANWLRLGSV